MNEDELISYLFEEEHEGCLPFRADGYTFYSLEGKGIVLSCDGTDLQFYMKPEYRGQGISTKYIRQIVRWEFERFKTLEITFQDDWFKRAIFDNLPHTDILCFEIENGFYLVNARKKGKFIEEPYEFKV